MKYVVFLYETADNFLFKCYTRKYFDEYKIAKEFVAKFNEGVDWPNVDWYCFADEPHPFMPL